jgi:hypothetical protein
MGKGSRRRKRVGVSAKRRVVFKTGGKITSKFKANLIPSDGGIGDAFAFSLSISGNTIAVGSFSIQGAAALAQGWLRCTDTRKSDLGVGRDDWGLEPQSPYPIDAGVGDGRGWYAPPFAPRSSIENPRDGGQQYIAPIEMRRTLVEV